MYYYIPRTKWELVQWLVRYYPQDKSRFIRMGKHRLWAIFYSVRHKLEVTR